MAAAVARSPQRPPRKKHSFISLHRDKSIDSKIDKTHSPPRQPGYFDIYPGRAETKSREGPKTRRRENEIYAFPSVGDRAEDLQLTPQGHRDRHRSTTSRAPDAGLPPLRFSGSSAFSHSPPVTPTSASPPGELMGTANPLRVLMSAPIVETTAMDAFVDGMNGGEEDVFANIDALRGSRRRKKSTSSAKGFHHPLYHPPLPTPPPGVKLGGGVSRMPGDSDADDDDSDDRNEPTIIPSRPRSTSSRQGSTCTLTPSRPTRHKKPSQQLPSPPATVSPRSRSSQPKATHQSPSPPGGLMDTNASIDEIVRRFVSVNDDGPPKPPVPSISDIIRTHAPEHSHQRHKPRLSASTPCVPPSVPEEHGRQSQDERSDILSRSSIDSIAEEVQRSLQIAREHPATALHHARSFPHPRPTDQRTSSSKSQGSAGMRSRRSEGEYRSPSVSSFSTSAHTAPPSPYVTASNGASHLKADSNQALATFLRSPRLTRLLKLTRSPNHRLQVSFSDLGSSTGKPVVVFLGLGCVRYIMGLYDEMAEALGLRLITIDRWGLGRTDNPVRNAPRGVREWASVVEEVLDYLNVDRCSIMAHSAGAPYAMAFASRNPERVQGDLCLLAPWVGAGEGASGYKWLKYVPTGLIKTAQAAEWKVQAWMLGKPPAISYTGIGYNLRAPVSSSTGEEDTGRPSLATSLELRESRDADRPSISSSFSDYDDLADFQGNYASRSTIHIHADDSATANSSPPCAPANTRNRARSKSNRLFGGFWKSGEFTTSAPPVAAKGSPKLKALKSMSSLRGAAASKPSVKPQRPLTAASRASTVGNVDDEWGRLAASMSSPTSSASSAQPDGTRGHGRTRRSISLTASVASKYSQSPSFKSKGYMSSPPTNSLFETSTSLSNAALGNALLAASHAESSKGTHADLLQILNHNQRPWGFSYENFPHTVRVWYGEKDDKIAEGAVKWMEKTMRPGTCEVCIVKGAGHGLMYNGGVVVEALEFLKETWSRK